MHKHIARLVFLLLPVLGMGQLGSTNPYSSYGIGIQNATSDPIQSALGGASLAYSDSSFINYSNAASYWKIASGFPLFSLGLNGTFSQYQEGNTNYNTGNIAIDHFVLAFPFAKRFGLAFGLTPFATRGYGFSNSQPVSDSDTLYYTYKGKGNISKFFGGLSAAVVDREKFTYSIGFNYGHLFGQTVNERTSRLSGTNSGGVNFDSQRLRAFQYDIAMMADYRFDKNRFLTLSMSYEPSQKWKTSFGNERYYSSNIAQPSLYQTLDSTFYAGQIRSAQNLAIGFNYTYRFARTSKKNRDLRSEMNVLFSYRNITYSKMTYSLDNVTFQNYYTNDAQNITIGLQYSPNIGYLENSVGASFFNKMKYRVGFYQSTLPYSTNGKPFTQLGTTFGFGLPILAQFSFSSLNFGFDLGKRGNGEAGSLNEKYLGINVGIVLSPSGADRWFRKVKLD